MIIFFCCIKSYFHCLNSIFSVIFHPLPTLAMDSPQGSRAEPLGGSNVSKKRRFRQFFWFVAVFPIPLGMFCILLIDWGSTLYLPVNMEMRKSWEIPLLNVISLDQLTETKLPKKLDVLRLFFHLHKVIGLTIPKAKRRAVRAACILWEKIGIKTKAIQYGVDDLTRIFEQYRVSLL